MVQDRETFHRAVVSSVALSCLLAMDYVPKSKPPPMEEMVKNELPRVLSVITKKQNLGLAIEAELHHALCSDPPGLLARVTDACRNLREAGQMVTETGHHDMVFSALRYSHKPPTASENRISRVTNDVARLLGVDIPGNFDEVIGDIYDSTHGTLIRV